MAAVRDLSQSQNIDSYDRGNNFLVDTPCKYKYDASLLNKRSSKVEEIEDRLFTLGLSLKEDWTNPLKVSPSMANNQG